MHLSQFQISDGFKLLRLPNVRTIFISYLVTYMGTAMAPIAMAFGVLELTGSTKDTAFVLAAPTLAGILIVLLGGAIADRTSRQAVIVIAEVVAMLVQLTIGLLFITGEATLLLLSLLMFINGAAMAFNGPASAGFIPQLVEKEALQATNALLGISRNGAMIFGAALGGVLVAWVGAGVTLLIDALSFGFSALLVWRLVPKRQIKPEKTSMFQDLKLGWKAFSAHRWIWVIVLQFAFVVAAVESVFALIGPAVAKTLLGGPMDWGFISGGLGLGTVLGGMIAFKIRVTYPLRLATICVLFLALMPLTLSVPLSVLWIATSALVAGIAIEVFSVIWMTTLQRKIPAHLLSRVSAYDHIGSISLAPLGIVVAGYLFESWGYRNVLWLSAATILIPTIAVLFVKDVWNMTDAPDALADNNDANKNGNNVADNENRDVDSAPPAS